MKFHKKKRKIPPLNIDRDEHLVGEGEISQKEEEIPPSNVNRDKHLVGEGEISQKEESAGTSKIANNNLPKPSMENPQEAKCEIGVQTEDYNEKFLDDMKVKCEIGLQTEDYNENILDKSLEKHNDMRVKCEIGVQTEDPEKEFLDQSLENNNDIRVKCEIGVQTEDSEKEFLDQSLENHNDMTQVGQADEGRHKNRDTYQCDPNSSSKNTSLLSLSEGPLEQGKEPSRKTRKDLDRQTNVKDEISNKDKFLPISSFLPSSDESATLQSEKIEDEIPDRYGSSSRQQDLQKIKEIFKENFPQNDLTFSDWLRLIHSGFDEDDEFEIDPNLEIKINDLDPNKDYDKHLDLMMEKLERENVKIKLKRLKYERKMRLEKEKREKEKNKKPILMTFAAFLRKQKEEDDQLENHEEAEGLRNFMKQFLFDSQHPNKTPDLKSTTLLFDEFEKD